MPVEHDSVTSDFSATDGAPSPDVLPSRYDAGGGASSPADQAVLAAQHREMSSVELFDGIGKKTLPTLLQVATIAAVAASSLVASSLVVLAAGGLMLAFELGRAYMLNRADLNRERVLYHKEIARAVGKSPCEEVTVADMRRAAEHIKPLKMELKHLDHRAKYNYVMGAARAAVTTAIASATHGLLHWEQISMRSLGNLWMPLSGAMMTVGAATMGIEKLGKEYSRRHRPPSVYTELTHLQEQVRQHPIQPGQVFEVTVKLDKELAKDVQNRFGKQYHELTSRNKERAVAAFEERAHTKALAEGINDGKLPVTAIAMSAFGQTDWPQEAPCPPQQAPRLERGKSFVAALLAQASGTPALAAGRG